MGAVRLYRAHGGNPHCISSPVDFKNPLHSPFMMPRFETASAVVIALTSIPTLTIIILQ